MQTTLHPSTFWQRLQRNGEANVAMLTASGIRPELIREVVCPVCGMQENAVFWSCRERTEHFLHLRCPRCERGSLWYSLKMNDPIESFMRLSRVLCGSAALLLLTAAGSLVSLHPELLPPRLETRVVAAREAITHGRQQLEGSAGFAAGWLREAASTGYQRTLLLKDTENLSGFDDRPVLGYRARQFWNSVVTLGAG